MNRFKCRGRLVLYGWSDTSTTATVTVASPDGRSPSFSGTSDLTAISFTQPHEGTWWDHAQASELNSLTDKYKTYSKWKDLEISCSYFYGRLRLLCSLGFSPRYVDQDNRLVVKPGICLRPISPFAISSAQPPWFDGTMQEARAPTWNTMRRRVVVWGRCDVIGSCFSWTLQVGLPVYVLIA